MKKFLTICAVALCLTSCADRDHTNDIPIETHKVYTRGNQPLEVVKFELDSVHYIAVHFGEGDYSWGGITIDPKYSHDSLH